MNLIASATECISRVSSEIQARRQTCQQVLERCLARIDEREAQVRAWVLVDRDGAVAQARRLDEELAAGRWRGPLHGIPVGIKDIVDVSGLPTAAGSAEWRDRVAETDATLVARLRACGAVIVGKTVTTQHASFDPPPTRNPWNRQRTPGGSSSGSAAAVACGMCLAAIGSQTGGSITRPASYCGVAGCKPTYGRVSCHGVLPLAPSMDHPGPMARTVHGLAVMLDAIAGPDPKDWISSSVPYTPVAPTLAERGRPPRLGRLRGLFQTQASPEVHSAVETALQCWAERGAEQIEVALPRLFDDVIVQHRVIMAVEAAAIHESRFQNQPEAYLPRISELIREGLSTRGVNYARARLHQAELRHAMPDCFQAADVLVAPATPATAPTAETTGDPLFNSPWSYTGLPVVSFPVALSQDGLPIAIQLIGRPFAEKQLFQVAHWCESVLRDQHATSGV